MNRKKLLLISQNFYPEIGSAGNRMKNVFLLLKESGYDVTVVTAEPTYPDRQLYDDEKFWDDKEFECVHGSDIHRVTVNNRSYSSSFISRLLYYIEIASKILFFILQDKRKYDFVIATSPPIFIGIVGLAAKIRFRCRMILDIRDLWPESLRGVGVFNQGWIVALFRWIEAMLYRHADHILVNSMGFNQYITANGKVSASKISFLPNAAREFEFQQKVPPADEFKVIYSGNIGLAQDVELLKGLAKRLHGCSIKLSIAGYGVKREELSSFVRREKLTNVEFISPLTRSECLKVNASHHVGFVSLSDKEVFDTVLPGKVIDYLSCGLPVVAAVSGYTKEFIESQKVGYVSESRNMDEIVDYLLMLAKHPAMRKKLANNCKSCARENFLWEKNIEVITRLIESGQTDRLQKPKNAYKKRKVGSL
ncbi:glycosyltransferase family 4 protein [Bacillus infantis]|uniref:glycosyltransferase family 4 protein n=1 Tax=Bacillus infantis TaxID=324767 RepID=UPI00215583E2|nr:glycosyltransferase family 4 protein [Bacillus infantis]MCR6612879.1 glycosyltransferase family 4 protein [Bacillus infantis]